MIVDFTRQLYTLMKAGLPLLKALQIVCVQLPTGKFKDDIDLVIQQVQEGKSFSESLSSLRRRFSLFYINMIKAAEVSGNMVDILRELVQHLLQQRRIARQVQTAFMYPAFVLIIAVAILLVLLIFVLPVFMRIFEDLGGSLPTATLLLIGLSRFILRWGWLCLLLGISLVAIVILLVRRTKLGKRLGNMFVWHLPLFGRIVKTIDLARFCRTLGTMLASGVTLVKGLDVLKETSTSVLMTEAIDEILYKVEQGKSLSLAMEETNIFPLSLVRMIQVAEESGRIAELFLDMAEDYEEEVSFTVTGLLSLLEPLLIVVMGVVVGFIVVSLFFPIFTISGLVK
ncbi:MAG: type II secretion system F family protein [Candidatus Omnitrophica bacterium]|nr:type II secretion system F family protein [Candidatus Omnitrophota bacterium]